MIHNRELIVILLPDGHFTLDWQETDTAVSDELFSIQKNLWDRFASNFDEALLFLGFSDHSIALSESLSYIRLLASGFVRDLVRNPEIEVTREKTVIECTDDLKSHFLECSPFLHGAEFLNEKWITCFWLDLNLVFSREIKEFKGSVAEFIACYSPRVHLAGRVYFHLVESKKEEFPFAFLATYSGDVSAEGKSRHFPLQKALQDFGKNGKKLLALLSTVNKASEKSAFISGLLETGEIFYPLNVTSSEAYTFLREVPLYEEAGVLCRIPDWWKTKSGTIKISVRLGKVMPSRLGFEALVDFDAELSLDGETISVKELKKMIAETEGLAFLKGKWVEVDHEKLKEILKVYENAQKVAGKGDLTVIDAMRFQMNSAKLLNISGDSSVEIEVTNGEWLSSVIENLLHPEIIKVISGGDDFHGQLRPYQERGLSWLALMKTLGLGACLADDMGLGKTVQVIALLNHIRTTKKEKTLLVVPASLIGNWMSELFRFAPLLKFYILHPSENKNCANEDRTFIESHDLCVTTYAMMVKCAWLRDIAWDTLILDEAQAIKNPGTKQTRAVKLIEASYKVAMTGTPIENRLSDLWSLFDFLNKGLLGSIKDFADFSKQLQDAQGGYSRLKKVVSPFILRRLKTDKTVISDLPEKIEMKTYASLSKKQTVLYNSIVESLIQTLATKGSGIERKGLILSSIIKFKQICNHPDQYLGQGFYVEEESGKYERLREICETILAKRERVLIFTQFKEMTAPLQRFLEQVFGHEGLVLHGETPIQKRKEIVEKFQGSAYVPFLVLSIKAGGVGLNLTAASHVIHFDRWWNPAVENQATDRAFRIGQKKNVIVHKFITRGTIEEKIDLMIEDKMKLSKDIVPDIQESWITEMDNGELMNLFTLSL